MTSDKDLDPGSLCSIYSWKQLLIFSWSQYSDQCQIANMKLRSTDPCYEKVRMLKRKLSYRRIIQAFLCLTNKKKRSFCIWFHHRSCFIQCWTLEQLQINRRFLSSSYILLVAAGENTFHRKKKINYLNTLSPDH